MVRFVQRGKPHYEPIAGLPGWMSSILRNRGIDSDEKARNFLNPEISQLWDPYAMQDMEKAVRLIQEVKEQGGSIVVYGDYDVDGVSATAIMLETLEEYGVHADYYIPSRHTEGYGLNLNAVQALSSGHSLLITVDCGISSVEEVRHARELGMRVIVTDHHQPPETLPDADALLNPLLGEYPFRRLCGAGVALKVTHALLGLDAVMRRIDIAALATVADVVPLVDENRVIVRLGMEAMNSGRRAGLAALCTCAQVTFPMTSSQVAFRLAPRINAGGRMEHAAQCVELLIGKDPEQARRIAEHLEANNTRRRTEQNAIYQEALTQVHRDTDFYQDVALVVSGNGWNKGVIGLVAGKLCEEFHMPVIALAVENGMATGSCRSVPGVNIYRMLTLCAGDLERYGGHEQAAGLTLEAARIREFQEHLNQAIRENCDLNCLIPAREYDVAVSLDEITLDLIDQMDRLEPTGFGNPEPMFLIRDASLMQAKAVGQQQQHLKVRLEQNRAIRDGIAFSQGKLASRGYQRVDVLGVPVRNTYQGVTREEIRVETLCQASGRPAMPVDKPLFQQFMQEIQYLSTNNSLFASENVDVPGCTHAAVVSAMRDGRGILLLTHDPEAAAGWLSESQLDLCFGRTEDPRGFNTVLLMPDLLNLRDQWHQIVFVDGPVLPGEFEMVHRQCPRAQLCQLKDTGRIRRMLQSLRLSYADMARLYRSIPVLGISPEDLCSQLDCGMLDVLAGLQAFSEIGLVELNYEPWYLRKSAVNPKEKHALEGSVTLCYLRAIQENAEQNGK